MLWSIKMDPNLNDYHMVVPQASAAYEELAWGWMNINELYMLSCFFAILFLLFSFPFLYSLLSILMD